MLEDLEYYLKSIIEDDLHLSASDLIFLKIRQ